MSIAMTLEQATALVTWAVAQRFDIFSPREGSGLWRLDDPPDLIRGLLLDDAGAGDVSFDKSGRILLSAQLVGPKLVVARALIDRSTPRKTGKAAQTFEDAFGPDEPGSPPVPKNQAEATTPVSTPPDRCDWQLVDAEAVRKTVSQANDRRSRRKQTLEMLAAHPTRRLPAVTDPALDAVRALADRFPNFAELIRFLGRHLRLRQHTGAPLHLPPVLMVGPPGLGKSRFATCLAEALPAALTSISLADTTANWVLSGAHDQWHSSTYGMFARAALDCGEGQAPLVFLDEIDKARVGNGYSVDTALLGILEPVSARTYQDEYLGVAMDLRPLSLILAANRLTGLRPEILSRVRVFDIPAPRASDMPAIVRSIDALIRADDPGLAKVFAPLDEGVITGLATRTPREIRIALADAYASALDRACAPSKQMTVRDEDFGPEEFAATADPKGGWPMVRGPLWIH